MSPGHSTPIEAVGLYCIAYTRELKDVNSVVDTISIHLLGRLVLKEGLILALTSGFL